MAPTLKLVYFDMAGELQTKEINNILIFRSRRAHTNDVRVQRRQIRGQTCNPGGMESIKTK